ncbi:hypothetical protein MKQ68_08260 [Chitinophaga horti]|uniref:Uncharacterized protein n=1 Tax=Chitinophaga horti TaxID=2920382 RepID=A0ABY6J9R5_9BACT|nr:hypothetical protein [Chitinophaga horti]UYQ95087.1 hypothetical protein MKQ68_08260 [Chitinophaga horti]
MVQVTYSYKNREFFQMEDRLLNQLAESGKRLLFALLEPMEDLLMTENGKIRICLDERPNIELEGFSAAMKHKIECTLRGDEDEVN